MKDDLRQNPRFVMTGGVTARIGLDGDEMAGILQNFSSTGLAVIIEAAPEDAVGKPVEVRFPTAGPVPTELHLTAEIVNVFLNNGRARLGCRITDQHGSDDAYFAFLTKMMFSQGLIRSMATKPVKYRGE